MKTQLGNTTKSFGKDYNISVSNIGGDGVLMAYSYLRENTIIIDSKVDSNFEDLGSYSLFVTDSNGNPVRLTYTIQPGNGLYADPADTDVLRMVIDQSSIMANDGDEIYVNKHNIIDNNTLTVNSVEDTEAKRGRIAVVTANLDKASNNRWGITKADEVTTYINPEYEIDEETGERKIDPETGAYVLIPTGVICVNTQNLDTVDDTLNRDGIVRHSSEMFRTIEAKDGKLNVLTYNLDKASYTDYGVIKTDNVTIQADDNGVVSVLTAGLDHSNKSNYGISKGDEVTINSVDGILTVNTRNLSYATYTQPGIVIVDSYSMTVNNGKIEVNRYNEIESILDRNNPEHDLFRSDIEDLKNRVSKLETAALQEVIEFLIPVGDPETSLPQPIFDRETWSVNHYSDRKTISFSIKTNCKFNVNVEYKNGTNDYSQVELINVRYGDEDTIPANQLANTIFNATGNTVKTLYFTFAVKNYDKDDNLASINTQAIISAASINDSSIKQTQFHIFKCWNNIAFTEDEPEQPEIPEEIIIPESYLVAHPGTERLQIYGNSYKDATLAYNKTASNNVFFNTYINATYTYCEYDSINKEYVWSYEDQELNQSSIISDNGSYNIQIRYNEIKDGVVKETTKSLDWLTTSITATYNTTRQFNVLNINSTKPINTFSRSAYITCYLSTVDIDSVTPSFKQEFKEKVINKLNVQELDLSNIKITRSDIIPDDNNYTGFYEKELHIIENLNKLLDGKITNETSGKASATLNAIKEKVASGITLSTVNTRAVSNVTPEEVDANLKVLEITQPTIKNAKKNFTNLTNSVAEKPAFTSVLENDIKEYSTLKKDFDLFCADAKITEEPKIYKQNDYITYYSYVEKLNKYAGKIMNEYNNFVDVSIKHKEEIITVPTANVSYITFKYTETMDIVQPIINVSSSINSSDNGIKFTVTRNENSLLKNKENYAVKIYYHYINKSGELVNPDGTALKTSTNPEVAELKPGTSTNYSKVIANNVINGTNTTTTQETIYYNVIAIDGRVNDRASFLGIGEGNKDAGVVFYGGWWPNVNDNGGSTGKTIEDNIYAVYKLTGQDASFGIFSQKYSFWSVNLKGKKTGYSQDLAQSNDIEFVGLSRTQYTKASSASYSNKITIGKNVYISGKFDNNMNTLQNTLNNAAKQYYTNNKISLKYSVNNITNKIANNVTGIKIKSVSVSPNDAFYVTPTVNYTSSGSWQSTGGEKDHDNESKKKYTFGNARIVAVSIPKWDDFGMNITFTIAQGSETYIPDNTSLIELTGSSAGRSNIIFLQGSKSYEYSQFYNNLQIECSTWKSNTCTVTFKLSNPYSLNETPGLETKEYFYNSNTNKLDVVYVDQELLFDGKKNRNYIKSNVPLLSNITSIKFWLGVTSNDLTLEKTFVSSLSSIGTEVLLNGKYDAGCGKSINVVNANYNTSSSVDLTNSNLNKNKPTTNTSTNALTDKLKKDLDKTLNKLN